MTTIAQIPKSPRIAKSVSIGRCTKKQAETYATNMIAKGRTPSNDTITLKWDVPLVAGGKATVGKNYMNQDAELIFDITLDCNGTIAASCEITKADLLEMVRHIEAIEAQKGLPIDYKNSFKAEYPKE